MATELFSDLARTYPDVQEMVLSLAAANWKAVKDTQGMRELQMVCKHGEADESTLMLFAELAMRL